MVKADARHDATEFADLRFGRFAWIAYVILAFVTSVIGYFTYLFHDKFIQDWQESGVAGMEPAGWLLVVLLLVLFLNVLFAIVHLKQLVYSANLSETAEIHIRTFAGKRFVIRVGQIDGVRYIKPRIFPAGLNFLDNDRDNIELRIRAGAQKRLIFWGSQEAEGFLRRALGGKLDQIRRGKSA